MTSSADSNRYTRERLPNKTQWALGDIVALCNEAREDWNAMLKKAERQMDPLQVVYLARLRDHLAAIERKAADALNGEYRE